MSVASSPAVQTGRRRVQSAGELWKLAQELGDRSQQAAALRVCHRALRRVLDDPTTLPNVHAQILVTLGCFESELGHAADALGHLDEALGIDSSSEAAVLAARGMVLLRSGNPGAMSALGEAIDALQGVTAETARPGAGPSDLAAALVNRGVLHMSAGRLAAARLDTEAAQNAAQEAQRPRVVMMARHNLGYIKYLEGDLPSSLLAMSEAAAIAPETAHGIQALDRSRVLLSAGLLAEAAEFADEALRSFRGNRAMSDLAEAALVRAEVSLLARDPKAAVLQARSAAKIYSQRGNVTAMLTARLMELRADVQLRQQIDRGAVGPPARRKPAGRDHTKAAALANDLEVAGLSDQSQVAWLLQSEELLDSGDPGGAVKLLQRAATIGRPEVLATRLHTRLVAGRIAITVGERTDGMTEIRRGLDDLADFQARFGSQDLQSAAAIHGRELARLGLRTATSTGSPAAILQWLERARAATTRLPAVRPPLDPILADELGALRVADEQARAALLAGKRDPAADKRVAELRRRVRARSWTVSGTGRADRPPSLAGVQRLLAERRPDAGVVALFTGGAQIHALVITSTRARHLVLAERAELEAIRHRLQGDLDLLADERIPARLAAVAAGSMSQSLRRMGEAFEPVLGVLGSGPVLIAAVGPLATVPWSLLPGLGGRPVTVSSSVTRALAGWSTPVQHPAANGVLVVAGPDVTNGDKEAGAIAALHSGATLLTGEQATGRAVLAAISPGGLVHIAAHGHHEVGNPLFSGVKLADGLLFGYDFAPNPALPGQVVLSSCDVGQTDERPGGEPLGLVAALVRSGVPTVITGTSRIGDSVAEAAMVGYHELLLTGVAPAVALAASVALATASTGLPAPFSCFGAGL